MSQQDEDYRAMRYLQSAVRVRVAPAPYPANIGWPRDDDVWAMLEWLRDHNWYLVEDA